MPERFKHFLRPVREKGEGVPSAQGFASAELRTSRTSITFPNHRSLAFLAGTTFAFVELHLFFTFRQTSGVTAILVVTATHTSHAFYIAGGTLPGEASSYVTRQADTDLFESLLAGEFCYVLNTRQLGKSSLMVRTASRLRKAGLSVAVLDLTAVGQNLSPEQWYDGLLLSLAGKLALEDEIDDFWQRTRR